MSFLIFAYRKLFLRRQINDHRFRILQLDQEEQSIQRQSANVQQSMSSAKNMLSIFGQSALAAIQNEIYGRYTDKETGQLNIKDGDREKVMQEMQTKQYAIMMANSACNSVFDSANQAMMQPLHAKGTQIELEKKSLESELLLLTGELKGVEDGEKEAAKDCAPKFGIA